MSPWHDVAFESSSGEEDEITGVIEITSSTSKKLETNKQLPFNPIMQDTTTDKATGKQKLRSYVKPPKFNYGFVPRTWCSDKLGGDSDAIDLVDLS
jgi:3'-phosphoadenosine 5'-phosphosulfate synthase